MAAQSYSVKGWWGPASPPFSPVVEKNNALTFRVKAPNATAVNLLFGEWNIQPQPMKKDTAGIWTITIPPVQPGIYSYQFSIDGATAIDLHNPAVKSGTEVYGSIVQVPGTSPRFDEVQNVPHGSLITLTYLSTILQKTRSVVVYLPPDYFSSSPVHYPVLILRHGGGDNETSWTQAPGSANVILDNLIAAKKAMPMIMVMPNGLTDGTWAGGSTKEGMEMLEKEMLTDIMPLVEKSFRTKNERSARAIAGLSMGGGQAYIMCLRNLDKFAWIGDFSSGLLSDSSFDVNDRAPGVFSDSTKINKQLKLLWVGVGTHDPRLAGHHAFANMLSQKGIHHTEYNVPGGHEWTVWRLELAQFLQKLFQ